MSSSLDPPTLNIADDDDQLKPTTTNDTRWPVITDVQSVKLPLLVLNMLHDTCDHVRPQSSPPPAHLTYHHNTDTGDRPYKCQHCGDQFARRYAHIHLPVQSPHPCCSSDLLARHINKCHANEKPLPNTTTGNRRKGSATAASRATTSKQACDQCVQSSLPCDGSNPCCT